MLDDCFLDSNILLYTLDRDTKKQEIAFALWRQGVALSTQVVMEFTNVCLRKLNLSKEESYQNALNLMDGAVVKPITQKSIHIAFDISRKYGFSHWDSLIIASSREAGCNTLYSEDFQHGQVINGKLKIVNPFLGRR